jgi:hypothetical protein
MERELPRPPATTGGGGGPEPGADIEQARVNLESILSEADRILDGLRPVNAEDYLQQNRQRGGE